jgi:aldehyde dehydrogenase (NAD+)
MKEHLQFYIDGQWVDPASARSLDVINPPTRRSSRASAWDRQADVDQAVQAARRAFESFSRTTREARRPAGEGAGRVQAPRRRVAQAISLEMGAPLWLSKAAQAAMGVAHLKTTLGVLKTSRSRPCRAPPPRCTSRWAWWA